MEIESIIIVLLLKRIIIFIKKNKEQKTSYSWALLSDYFYQNFCRNNPKILTINKNL